MNKITLAFLFASLYVIGSAQPLDSIMPVRGLSIAAPMPKDVSKFVNFINDELGPGSINTLILRVDYNFQYETHPELRNEVALSKEEVKEIVGAARSQNIKLVPQINLLGHQSWAGDLEKLLEVYPEFDETPHVQMPEDYQWPNEDGLYCKSYCPLHPEVHDVVFDLVGEILEVFETKDFHAGMDEVFYLGDDRCPRCAGKDKAELFAGEVTRIRDFLNKREARLWIWGDRLLDGSTTGLGMWEASENNTSPAIDMIPDDVLICDWHYEKAEPTPPYFAQHGLQVMACPWRKPEVGLQQVDQMILYRTAANSDFASKFRGVVHTVWSPAGPFLTRFYEDPDGENSGDVRTLKALLTRYQELANE